jgi:cytoskeletal protein RodZ
MSRPTPPNPQSRDRAQQWLRRATRAIVLAATGAAAVIGIVVAQEHPGASSTSSGAGSSGSGSSGGSTGSSSSSNSDSSNTGSTGNTGAATTPSISGSTPSVTSGGTSR